MNEGQIVSVVLAAGAGRRFGGRKQLALLAGVRWLSMRSPPPRPARTLLVLGSDAEEIERGIELGRATAIRRPDWEKGQGASLRCGLAALGPDVGAALVSLGDEPFISPEAARRVIAARHDGAGGLPSRHSDRSPRYEAREKGCSLVPLLICSTCIRAPSYWRPIKTASPPSSTST